MTESAQTPEFIVVEDDPLVLMDIRDMLMREFGTLPLSLDTVVGLAELLSEVGRPAVVIASCKLDDLVNAVREKMSDALPLSAVLLSDPPKEAVDFAIDVSFVSSPFSSERLMHSVTAACAHLRSFQ